MKFWDASAIVPLLVKQGATAAATDEYKRDPAIVTWWGTAIECESALARLLREAPPDEAQLQAARHRAVAMEEAWREVEPSERIRQLAKRLLRVHPLRAADALQLAAALVAAEDEPRTLPLVTLDDRLANAAEREGFPVVRPGAV